ncbi:MAG TPA: hypothetical protein VD906_10215 [Caulobacteraceae bacterium]|nr:hypothetical protein [Caulobacteraceae bacterium]
MTIDTGRLRAKWGWSFLLSLIPFGVMAWLDAQAKAVAGYGILDLQFAATEARAGEILGAWTAAGIMPHIGFSLGIDYLYMPLYGAALFYGALVAREAYPSLRGPLTLAAWAGPVAAVLDAVENAIHAGMVMGMCDLGCVTLQYPVTLGKWALVVVGLVASIIALAGLRRLGSARP